MDSLLVSLDTTAAYPLARWTVQPSRVCWPADSLAHHRARLHAFHTWEVIAAVAIALLLGVIRWRAVERIEP